MSFQGVIFMFEKIDIKDLAIKPFELIGDQWMLVTAGSLKSHNTMTASWGGVGIMWFNPVLTIYVRPQRYTKEFLDKSNYFTASFYDSQFKSVLQLCGTKSGREIDKSKATGLVPKKFGKSVAFEQAKLVIVCEKQYVQQISPDCFIDSKIIDTAYKNSDFHFMYIAKIVEAYRKK